MTTKFTLKTNTQRPPPHFKSRVRRCVYNCPPWPPTAGKALQKRDTDEPDLERAAREFADGAYHANIAPTENGFWVEAKDLRVGDVFIGVNGELSVLVDTDSVELDEPILVYNFAVEGNHNYFVIAAGDEYGQTSVLVHNAQNGSGLPNSKARLHVSVVLFYLVGGKDDNTDARINLLINRENLRPLRINMDYGKKGLSGSTTGTHQFWDPGRGPDYVGATGMGPCIGVVIYSPCGQRAAFHFGPSSDGAVSTLNQYDWPPDSKAIIAGATGGSATTVAELQAILAFFNQKGISVEGFDFTHNIQGIYVDRSGKWVVVPTNALFEKMGHPP